MIINILGDFAPVKETDKSMNDLEFLSSDIQDLLQSANVNVFNLEAPICSKKKRLLKVGPNLNIDTRYLQYMQKYNLNLASVANNHIFDYGVEGYFETVENLLRYDISTIGVEKNYTVLDVESKKIAIYSLADHEFNSINENSVNLFKSTRFIQELNYLSKEVDYIVVLYHSGKEEHKFPTPELQQRCRLLVDYGANIVVTQHSHTLGVKEIYKDNTIYYGQGNFYFNLIDSDHWNSGVILSLKVGKNISVEENFYIKKGEKLFLSEDIKENFYSNTSNFNRKGISESFNELIKKETMKYLGVFLGFSKVLRFIDRRLKGAISKRMYKKRQLLTILNYLECETHLEILKEVLRSKIYD